MNKKKAYETLESMQVAVTDMIIDVKAMYLDFNDLELLDLLLKLQLTDIALDTVFYKKELSDRRNENGKRNI